MSEPIGGGADLPEMARLISDLLTECGSLAEVLELFYLTREPDLLPAMRALLRVPAHVRAALVEFVAQLPEPAHLHTAVEPLALTVRAMPPRH